MLSGGVRGRLCVSVSRGMCISGWYGFIGGCGISGLLCVNRRLGLMLGCIPGGPEGEKLPKLGGELGRMPAGGGIGEWRRERLGESVVGSGSGSRPILASILVSLQ